MTRPSGTVTFLFTDIEGSTRLWEADPDSMRVALAAHDDALRSAIEGNGGWLFKHTGDGVCAAFASARAAVDAAVDAQRLLELPVRMGIATGDAEQRGDDYFGPSLNRAARVMAVGHGAQILVSLSTAGLVNGFDLLDLGQHRLRDLWGIEQLFQVRAHGLATDFPPLTTVNAAPGNLPMQDTSFIGRSKEIRALIELVRAHRLVTLTGVGGVGKTRLVVQVAAELVPDFPDGVWLVELAPVGDPSAVPDVVATALGITTRAGMTVTASVAQALVGRRLLIVLDNCEHVIDATAELVEAILARSSAATIIATSREGLRVGAEQLWPVPSLDVRAGASSAAFELFVERAGAVQPGFRLDTDVDIAAAIEIVTRLDGIPLAIELAAARMMSMSPTDVRDRLGDRFRLLSGARRGLERHQTLRHAVQWSYELLNDDERCALQHASVFADGFDVAAITHVCEHFDEYTVLDLLDSLVRKSLVSAQPAGDRVRYGLLETIRAFAQEQLATTGTIEDVRDRHARYYATQVKATRDTWDGPRQRVAVVWMDLEYANLRAGFRWATDREDLDTAVAIAAHTMLLANVLQRYEPVGWAEELLPAAVTADVRQLPRLYIAAAHCAYTGRPEEAVGYAKTALALESDPRYEPFAHGWSGCHEANGHLYAGRIDRFVEIWTELAGQPGLAHIMGLCGLTFGLVAVGRGVEARAIANDALVAARAHANPYWVAWALAGYGRAFSETDPSRALDALREGLGSAREHRIAFWESRIGREAAGLEAAHGNLGQGLDLIDTTLDLFYQAGDSASLGATLANLAKLFDRFERFEIAATVYGSATLHASTVMVVGLVGVVDHLRTVLGRDQFDECVATGFSDGARRRGPLCAR
jgi:predicted ATPase